MPTPLLSEQAGLEVKLLSHLDRLLIAFEAPPTSHPERVCGSTMVSQLRVVAATPAARFAKLAKEDGDTPLAHPLDLTNVGPEEVETSGIDTTMPLERPRAISNVPHEASSNAARIAQHQQRSSRELPDGTLSDLATARPEVVEATLDCGSPAGSPTPPVNRDETSPTPAASIAARSAGHAVRARRGAGAQPPARFDQMIFSVLSAPSHVSSGLAIAANALQKYLQQRMTARRISSSSFGCDV